MDPNYSYQTPQRFPNDINASRGPQMNLSVQPPNGQFNQQAPSNQQPGQSYNLNVQGPSFNNGPDNMEVSERPPFSSE